VEIEADGLFFLLLATAFFLYITFVSIAPSRHGHRVQHAAYVFFLTLYCFGLSPLVVSSGYNPEWLIRRALWAAGVLTLYDICLPLNLLGNCMMWGSFLLTAHVRGSGECNASGIMGTIVACWLVASMWIALCNVVFIQGVVREMQMLTAQSERNAADSILQGICDVVVILDQELKVTHGAESVATMLMMSPLKIQGQSVLSLIPTEEDRERFAEMVRGSRSSAIPGPCTAFNTSLKDSGAISFNVEALCVKYLQADGGDESFLIGFREAADLPEHRVLTNFSSSARRSRHPQPPPAAQFVESPQAMGSSRGEDDLAAQDGSWDGASSSTERSSDNDDACTPTGCRPPAVWFDPGSPEFELVKSSAEFRMLTGFTEEEMADLGGVLTWVRNEQRGIFERWVRNFADSTQDQESRHRDAVTVVKFCIVYGKHKAQFQAEVRLETCWSEANSKTLKLVVHGFRARQKTQRQTRRTGEIPDDSSDADEPTSHEGERRARSRDFEVRESGLEVECDVGEGDNDDDPLWVTRRISPGLQLLLGTASTGQDVGDIFVKTEKEKIEIWLDDEYARRAVDDQTSATSLWCFLAMPALQRFGVCLEVNCRLTFQRGDPGMCIVIQKTRWSTVKRLAKTNVRRGPGALGTPARVGSARLQAAGAVAST